MTRLRTTANSAQSWYGVTGLLLTSCGKWNRAPHLKCLLALLPRQPPQDTTGEGPCLVRQDRYTALAVFTFFKRLALPLHTTTSSFWPKDGSRQTTHILFFLGWENVDISSCYSWAHLSSGILIPFLLHSLSNASLHSSSSSYSIIAINSPLSDPSSSGAKSTNRQKKGSRENERRHRYRNEQKPSPIVSRDLVCLFRVSSFSVASFV